MLGVVSTGELKICNTIIHGFIVAAACCTACHCLFVCFFLCLYTVLAFRHLCMYVCMYACIYIGSSSILDGPESLRSEIVCNP